MPVPSNSLDITFVIPCYNEAKNVAGAMNKVAQAASKLGHSFEIVVVDDCSIDNTSDVVTAEAQKHPEWNVQLIRNETNRGIAYNYIIGASKGSGMHCRLICGDDTETLEMHLTIIRELGKYDLVIPYYRAIQQRTAARHAISNTYTTLVNTLSGLRLRYYNGHPLLIREDLLRKRKEVEAAKICYQAELIVRLLREGKSYIEVEGESCDRHSQNIRFRHFVAAGRALFHLLLIRLGVLKP